MHSFSKYFFIAVCTMIFLFGANQLLVLAEGPGQNPGQNPGQEPGQEPGQNPAENPAPAQPAPEQPAPQPQDSNPNPPQGNPPGDTNQPPAPAIQCPDISAPGISVNVGGGSISWSAVPGAVSYKWRLDDRNTPGLSCNSNGDGCSENYPSTSMTWNFTPGHSYHFWVHAISAHCDSDAANTEFSVPGAPVQPTNPPAQSVSACDVTASQMAPGYTLYTPATCSAGQFLFVENQGGYLVNSCHAIPAGNVKDASGCGFHAAAPVPTAVPTAPPAGGPQMVSACGKTGVLATGYTLYTPATCAANQYLYVNVAGGYLENACLAIPSGNVKTANGCGYTASAVVPTVTPTLAPGQPTLTPTPTLAPGQPTPTTVPAGGTVINNNSATGGSVTIYNPAANNVFTRTRTVLASGNTVYATPEVKTLPKTGLPLGAWALSGLLPLGLGMKRWTKGAEGLTGNIGKALWQRREVLK